MIQKEFVLVEKEVVQDISCDFCKKSCSFEVYKDENGNVAKNMNYAKISTSFGYGSTKYDGLVLELQICEDCFDEIVKKHEIDVEKMGIIKLI